MMKERDELKVALLDFEKHVEEIQNNAKALCTERDHFKIQMKKVRFKILVLPDVNFNVIYFLKRCR